MFTTLKNTSITIPLTPQAVDQGWSFDPSSDIATHENCNPGSIKRTGIPFVVNKTYKIKFSTNISSGIIRPVLGTTLGPDITTTSNQSVNIICSGGTDLFFYADGVSSVKLTAVTELSDSTGQTLAFNEKTKSFSTFYSYIPDRMVSILSNFITFKSGKPYLHESGDDNSFNKFYGQDQVPSEILFVVNNIAQTVKTFFSIGLITNSEWQAIENERGPGITTETSQESNLLKQDYIIEQLSDTVFITNKEGTYYAEFYRDVNSPGGLANGDFLNGKWIKIRLTNDSDKFVYLWSLFVNTVV